MTSLPELVLSRTRADSSQAWYWAKLRTRRGPREPAARDVPVCMYVERRGRPRTKYGEANWPSTRVDRAIRVVVSSESPIRLERLGTPPWQAPTRGQTP